MSNTSKTTKTVFAPDYFNKKNTTNAPISVILDENDEIEWIWTNGLNGERWVSGYTIIKK